MTELPRELRIVDDGALYLREQSRQKRRPNFLRNGLPAARVTSFTREEKLAALALFEPV